MCEVTYSRFMCLICDDDYREHQAVISDNRGRCICLNCWAKIKRVV